MDDKKDRLATSPSSKPTAEPNARIDLIVQHFGHTVRITGSEAQPCPDGSSGLTTRRRHHPEEPQRVS
jgi:hypothetical protein